MSWQVLRRFRGTSGNVEIRFARRISDRRVQNMLSLEIQGYSGGGSIRRLLGAAAQSIDEKQRKMISKLTEIAPSFSAGR